jgi:hypothetical protein
VGEGTMLESTTLCESDEVVSISFSQYLEGSIMT